MQIGVYFQQGLKAEYVCEGIQKVFPMLEAEALGVMDPPSSAWDTYMNQYDATALLDWVKVPTGYGAVLWLIKENIGDIWHGGIFGAAKNNTAIVSAYRLDNEIDIVKEACHEVGHLLGLDHCSRKCLMQIALTTQDIRGRASEPCAECRLHLEAIFRLGRRSGRSPIFE